MEEDEKKKDLYKLDKNNEEEQKRFDEAKEEQKLPGQRLAQDKAVGKALTAVEKKRKAGTLLLLYGQLLKPWPHC